MPVNAAWTFFVVAEKWFCSMSPTNRPGAASALYDVLEDDLPEGESLAEALELGFGAEPGDRVVEVALGGAARAWVLGGVSGAAAA